MRIQAHQSNSREGLTLYKESGYTATFAGEPGNVDEPHYGSTMYCESAFGRSVRPDFYPDWTKPIWNRDIIRITAGDETEVQLYNQKFVKPSTWYKEDDGPFLTYPNQSLSLNEGRIYYVSDVVEFEHEWRLLVINGQVVDCSYYLGLSDQDEVLPTLPVRDLDRVQSLIPAGWHGTIDVGITDRGQLCLVEAHHPYSIGWYGDSPQVYYDFVVEGWKYMLSLLSK